MMKIRSAAKLGPRVRVDVGGESRTKQSMAEEADVNNIMKRFIKTGYIDHGLEHSGSYGFASSVSYHEAMNIVTKADSMFADLPAEARVRFEGDPAAFLDFCGDASNYDEMRQLGLLSPESAQETPEARTGDLPPAGESVAPATSEAAEAAALASD